ncbi:hypothetical protein ACFTZB_21840 [Rhodococcus sp. NPDC057014]|uniref:hypothetical protein n=1 Tax=Rhodococcus sp. NPDC057014 TaxID=3346000 RepID=UPI003626A0BF
MRDLGRHSGHRHLKKGGGHRFAEVVAAQAAGSATAERVVQDELDSPHGWQHISVDSTGCEWGHVFGDAFASQKRFHMFEQFGGCQEDGDVGDIVLVAGAGLGDAMQGNFVVNDLVDIRHTTTIRRFSG